MFESIRGYGSSLISSLRNVFLPKNVIAKKRNMQKRAYAAAQISRINSEWNSFASSWNYDIRAGLTPLRSRARELVQNDFYPHSIYSGPIFLLHNS